MAHRRTPGCRYWHILVPQRQFPKPKFHIGEQVESHWQDEFGNQHYDVGLIIGMAYGAYGYNRHEWTYLIRLIESDTSPSLVGSDDGCFVYESSLVARPT